MEARTATAPPATRSRQRAWPAAGSSSLLIRAMRITRGSLRMQPRATAEARDGVVVACTRNTARRGGRRLELDMTITYRVQDGRIAAIDEHVDDLRAWQRFWS